MPSLPPTHFPPSPTTMHNTANIVCTWMKAVNPKLPFGAAGAIWRLFHPAHCITREQRNSWQKNMKFQGQIFNNFTGLFKMFCRCKVIKYLHLMFLLTICDTDTINNTKMKLSKLRIWQTVTQRWEDYSAVKIVFFFILNRIKSNSWSIIWNFESNRIAIVGHKSHQ